MTGGRIPRSDQDEYFATERLREGLPGRAARSGLITFGAQPLKLALGAATLAVTARALEPADFGLIAMTAPLVSVVGGLRNLGMETAIVQRERLDHEGLTTLFWWTLAVNLLLMAAMAGMGPVLAWFYDEPALTGITAALAAGMLMLAVGVTHEALLKRQLRFGALTTLEIGARVAGSGAAIATALVGAGYWALVLESVVPQALIGGGYWAICRWRPGRPGGRLDTALRSMLAFGGNLTGFRLIRDLANESDRLLLGYAAGAQPLGVYTVARRWSELPSHSVFKPLSSVAVSAFSRSRNDPGRYRSLVRTGVMLPLSVVVPGLVFAFFQAENLLLILLGGQWEESVPLFRILVIGYLALAMGKVTPWLYKAEGATDRQLRWGLVFTPIQVGALVVGVRWGAEGVAWAFTASAVVLTPLGLWYCFRSSPVGFGDLGRALWRPVLATVAAGVALFLLRPIDLGSRLGDLAVAGAAFGGLYALTWLCLPGGWRSATRLLRLMRRDSEELETGR